MSTTKPVQYVNAKGEPINLEALAKKHQPIKAKSESMRRVDDRADAKVSYGFAVVGFSPEHLRVAALEHAKALGNQQGRELLPKEKLLGPWDENTYMRTNKPKRVRSKPYEVASAADQCAEMVRKAGWKNVRVEEIMRG